MESRDSGEFEEEPLPLGEIVYASLIGLGFVALAAMVIWGIITFGR